MVGVVSGGSLGLNAGSWAALGRFGVGAQGASQGRSGERAYVNVSSGNLVLQHVDGLLMGVGPDEVSLRTYNSQGQTGFGSNQGWMNGQFRTLVQLGNGNLERRDTDGSVSTYVWNATRGLYVETQTGSAGSALSTVKVENGTYVWTSGTTQATETYTTGGAGLLQSSTDASGNPLTYAYNASNQLTQVTDASGESITYTYTGNNLTQMTAATASGTVLSQVDYAYDTSNRLTSVKVRLTAAASPAYETTYTYDGTSARVASMEQSDGTKLSFTYVLVDGSYKVATVTDGLGKVTSYAYDSANRQTTVTDPLGVASTYRYDTQGQLVQVRTGVTAGNPSGLSVVSYAYNSLGDVTSLTDGAGRTLTLTYDGNGNLVRQEDAAGNVRTWTYTAANQVKTETVYATPHQGSTAEGQPLTTRYVYDDQTGHGTELRFVISPEGRVTEYRYNGNGLRTSTHAYKVGTYNLGSLAADATPTEAQMDAWVLAQDRTESIRTDYAYDVRGQLIRSTTYGSTDASGNGVAGTASSTTYVYDPQGQLLQTVTPDGQGTTQSVYDGMGRVLSTTSNGITTLTQYDDANGKTTVTFANGLSTVSTFDKAGRLVSMMQSSAGTSLGTTTYAYDADGRLRMVTGPTGQRSWKVYDDADRLVGEVDATGGLTEYVYDAANQVSQTIRYATAVNTGVLTDVSGNPTNVSLASIRPAGTAQDPKGWTLYDAAGRAAWTVDASGHVSQTQYDGANRVISVTRFATAISTSLLGNGQGVSLSLTTSGTGIIQVTTSTADRTASTVYGKDGQVLGVIDGEGYLTERLYDGAGQLTGTIAYATRISGFTNASSIATQVETARSAGTLDSLRPTANAADIRTYTYTNDRGQVIAQVDGEGYLTEFTYDVDGLLLSEKRYANKAVGTPGATTDPASLRPAVSAEDRTTTRTYDALNRLATLTNAEGTVTQYTYDTLGRVVSTTTAVGTTDQRTFGTRYDVQGRVVAELSAQGSAELAKLTNPTQAQIDGIWTQYGTRYAYDAAGRRISQTDALGHRAVFFYDDAGRLTHTVNATGGVAETVYDALGRVANSIQYATALTGTALTGLVGGVLSGTENGAARTALAAAKAAASASNNTTQYAYDAEGQLIRTTDAVGGWTTTTYNAFGEASGTARSITGTTSVSGSTSYDRRGLRLSLVGDVGGLNVTTTQTHDAFGRVIQSTDANGKVRQQTYDRLGRVVTTTDPLNHIRSTTYDAFDRVLTQTDALGKTTTYVYDKANRSTRVTTPEGVSVTTKRTRNGQTLSVTDGLGNTTSYAYDGNGNLLTATRPIGSTGSTYDAVGNVLSTTDANGVVTAYAYDASNRLLTRTVDPSGLNLTTAYAYDAKGQQVRVTDPKGTVTETAYDRSGRVLTQRVDPLGLNLTTTYAYDLAGQVLTVTAPGGTVTQYVYDQLGRRTQTVVDPGGLNLTTTHTYDRNGQVVASTDPKGNVSRFVYDANGRLIYTVDGAGGVSMTAYDKEGRVLSTTSYTKAISLTGLALEATEGTIAGLITAAGGQAIAQHRGYDADGRLTWTVDGAGAVAKLTYDANGNVVDQVRYANRIVLGSWTVGTVPTVTADAAHDQRVRTVYDALGRAVYTLSSTGDGTKASVVAQTYDANGNVVKRTAYAGTIAAGTAATASAVSTAVAAIADGTKDATIRRVYDTAGRLTWSVDGVGAVTQQVFDVAGNLVKQVAYATPISANANPSSVATSATDRVSLMAYDAAGRRTLTVDARGGVTQAFYDAAGNVVKRIAYATPVEAPTASSSASGLAAPATAAGDRITRAAYDTANREMIRIDASGAVTETFYDANSRVTASTAYATALSLTALKDLADGTRPTVATTANDRTSRAWYDAAGHRITSVDAGGFVTKTTYDGLGRVTATTLYATKLTGSDPAAVAVDASKDRTNTFVYDAAGNLVSSTDAMGFTEVFTYDGVGNKTSFTNKKTSTWNYDYDAAGRLVQETGPAVDVTGVATDANGNLVAGATTSQRIVTKMTYDALGNLLSRTEAAGIVGSERTTTYVYDALGHQIKTTFPPVGVYTVETAAVLNGTGLSARSETTQALTTQVLYNAFGEAIKNTDVAGNVSTKIYDATGRVRFEVDALGYVTGYERNTFGDVTALTRYAAKNDSNIGKTADPVFNAGDGANRTIRTDYDTLGQAVRVTQPEVWVNNGDGAGYRASAVTETEWNAFGQVSKVKVLADVVNGTQTWAVTTNFYDTRGHLTTTKLTATKEALTYVTVMEYDAAGNLTKRTEYDNLQLANWEPGSLIDSDAAKDRVTTYAYDKLDRKTSETKVGVTYSTGVTKDANGKPTGVTTATGSLTTVYAYDAVGNLTCTTDALGGKTYSWYDALGRVKAVAAPARAGVAAGSTLTPLMTFQRDAYGNVVVRAEWANGAASVSETTYTAGAPNTSADRTTLTQYDLQGRAKQVTDAKGNSAFTSYDAAGHTAKTWQWVKGNDAVVRTSYTVYEYDALGRQTAVLTPASVNVVGTGSVSTTTYNAQTDLGHTIGRAEADGWAASVGRDLANYYMCWGPYTSSLRDGAHTARFTLLVDNVTAANAQVAILEAYDWATGTIIAQRAVYRSELGQANQYKAFDVAFTSNSEQVLEYRVKWTGTSYVRVQKIEVIDPSNTPQIITRTQAEVGSVTAKVQYNAFGEVIDKGSFATGGAETFQERFEYNQAGQVWRTNAQDGNAKVIVYDLQGRQTVQLASSGTLDLNSLANAQAADALKHSGIRRTTNTLDLLGRVVQQTLPMRTDNGSVDGTVAPKDFRPIVQQTFDRWGNVLSMSDVRSMRYVYDAAGNSTLETAPAALWVTTYEYDAENRIVRQTQPQVGMIGANGAQGTVSPVTENYYDALGHQVAIRDARGFINAQTWDGGGQLASEIHADGGVVTYGYDAFGEKVKLTDAMGNVTTYAYDKGGLNTGITHPGMGVYTVNAGWTGLDGGVRDLTTTMTYDELGRKIKETDGAGGVTKYDYDLRGNVIATTDADGYVKKAAFDAQGKQIADQDAKGSLGTWAYDYFGLLIGHKDIGGVEYAFVYDTARQLNQKTDGRGVNLSYAYDAAGQLISIRDAAIDQTTNYGYNAAGKHVWEQTVQGGVTRQDQTLGYDALGRLALIDSKVGDMTLVHEYDQVGNRVHVRGDYKASTQVTVDDYGWVRTESGVDETGNPIYTSTWQKIGSHQAAATSARVQNLWSAYDEMNRQILAKGTNNNNPNDLGNISSGQGHILAYDKNGSRISDTYLGRRVKPIYVTVTTESGTDEAGNPIYTTSERIDRYEGYSGVATQWYAYDAMDRLSKVSMQAFDRNGVALAQASAITLDTRFYDGASRVVLNGPGSTNTGYLNALTGSNTSLAGATTTYTKYSAAGRMLAQHGINAFGKNNYAASANSGDYWVEYRQIITWKAWEQTGTKQTITGYTESGTPIYRTDPVFGWVSRSKSSNGYDAAGNLTAYRVTQSPIRTDYALTYKKFEAYKESKVLAVSTNTDSGNQTSGNVTSAYDVNGFLKTVRDTAHSENNRDFYNDASGIVLQKVQGGTFSQVVANGQVLGNYGVINNAIQGNFDLAFQALNKDLPTANSRYTVQSGDTLQGIALAVYGDASLWYVIAQENGLSGDGDLRVGQMLTIPPQAGGTHNASGTFKPYNPAEVVGSTTPNLPVPKGREKDDDCGALGKIIVIVVTIVVAIITRNYLLAKEVGAALAAGLGAAAGSLAGQGVGVALGIQEEINWKQVAAAGLTAGLMASPAMAWINKGIDNIFSKAFLQAAAKAAVADALNQGVQIAVGLQKSFDWQSVAMAGLKAGGQSLAGDILGPKLGKLVSPADKTPSVKNVFRETAYGMVTRAASTLARGGKVDLVDIAADAFGNALGNAIASKIGPPTVRIGTAEAAGGNRRTQPEIENLPHLYTPGEDLSPMLEPIPAHRPGDEQIVLVKDEELGQSANPQTQEADPNPPGRYVVAGKGDNISLILGTSDPQAIGAFMRANGLRSSTIHAGDCFFIPDDVDAFGDCTKLGQAVLNKDNARLARLAAERDKEAGISAGPQRRDLRGAVVIDGSNDAGGARALPSATDGAGNSYRANLNGTVTVTTTDASGNQVTFDTPYENSPFAESPSSAPAPTYYGGSDGDRMKPIQDPYGLRQETIRANHGLDYDAQGPAIGGLADLTTVAQSNSPQSVGSDAYRDRQLPPSLRPTPPRGNSDAYRDSTIAPYRQTERETLRWTHGLDQDGLVAHYSPSISSGTATIGKLATVDKSGPQAFERGIDATTLSIGCGLNISITKDRYDNWYYSKGIVRNKSFGLYNSVLLQRNIPDPETIAKVFTGNGHSISYGSPVFIGLGTSGPSDYSAPNTLDFGIFSNGFAHIASTGTHLYSPKAGFFPTGRTPYYSSSDGDRQRWYYERSEYNREFARFNK